MPHMTINGQGQEAAAISQWLLNEGDPWVRYQSRIQLLGLAENHPEVVRDRAQSLAHPKIQQLIHQAAGWPGGVIKRHNDAKHVLHLLPVLAELGIRAEDPGMDKVIDAVLDHQSAEGAFQSVLFVPRAFGGNEVDTLSWMLCDTPTVLYALLKLGLRDRPAVQRATEHLLSLAQEDGWPCASSRALGNIQGPGRKTDPCPYANLIVLKALACAPELHNHPAVVRGVEMLLWHWAHQGERKLRMFGIGTDFRKLKYPHIWYDILHVVDTLSQFSWVWHDARLLEMVDVVAEKQDEQGRYTPESVWMAWKDWDFGQKRQPSPWLTFLVWCILKRVER